jgi:hypothetical protein
MTLIKSKDGSVKLHRESYRGKFNELRVRVYVVSAECQKLYPKNLAGYVWGPKLWKGDSAPRYSRLEAVFEMEGTQYRFFERVARPLVLAEGEKLESPEFGGNGSFV